MKKKFTKLYDENSNCSDLLEAMRHDILFQNTEWKAVVCLLRDRKVKALDSNLKIPIVRGGQIWEMSNKDLEQLFIEEQDNSNFLASQKSIPAEFIHTDLFESHMNQSKMIQVIWDKYKINLNEVKDALRKDNPKLKESEVEKKAEAQALLEMRNSKEYAYLQQRNSLCAEYLVQKKILGAGRAFNVPMHIFRGVNTYKDISKFLEGLGIKVSELKSFTETDRNSTLECESDITIISLPPEGPVASFVQVSFKLFQV